MKSSADSQNKHTKLQNKVTKSSANNNVPWDELFNDVFMKKNSSYENLNQFIEASGFQIKNAEDFQTVPENEWNEFVKTNTQFNSWEDMLKEASTSWIKKKLGLSI